MKLKPFILPVFLAITLASIYFLPSAGEIAESAVEMDLPHGVGAWEFIDLPASQAEIDALSKDTKFSKAVCLRPRPGEYDSQYRVIPDRLDLSIVLSGADINNSIHRPERCMPAQGHSILNSTDREIKLDNGRSLVVRRLESTQRVPLNEQMTEFSAKNCVTYYFFVGRNQITNDHLHRTLLDMKDRLVNGVDQRWAYISVSMWYGEMPWNKGVEVTEEEVEEKMTKFVADFASEQIAWDRINL